MPTFLKTLSTPALTLTQSPTNGYVLTSDASGNASWAAAPSSSGGNTNKARLTADTAAIANTETVVLSWTIPANSSVAGDSYRIKGFWTRAGANSTAAVFRVRVGSTTLTGNIAATVTLAATTSTTGGQLEFIVTIRTIGASGTVGGGGAIMQSNQATYAVTNTASVAVDTTANKLIELTAISGIAGNTYTFNYATIEKMAA